MRLIDADALIETLHKDPLYDLVGRYGIDGVIESMPTVETPANTPTNTPTDLISRQAAIELACWRCKKCERKDCEYKDSCETMSLLEALPSEDPKPSVEPKPICEGDLFNKSLWRMGMHDSNVRPRTMAETSTDDGEEDAISRTDTIKAMCQECKVFPDDEVNCADCTEVAIVKGMPPVEPKRPKGDVRLYIPLDEYTVDRVNRLLKNECGEYFDEEWLYNELEQLAVLYPERPKGEWVAIPYEICGQGEIITDGYIWQCTNCGESKERNTPDMDYCPNCGADMRGEQDEK